MAMIFTWRDLGLPFPKSLEDRIAGRQINERLFQERFDPKFDADKRFSMTLETIVSTTEIWTVWKEDELAIYQYSQSTFYVPIYPTETAARRSCGEIDILSFVPIPLNDFVDEIIPSILDVQIDIGVFPTNKNSEYVVKNPNEILINLVGAWEYVHDVKIKHSDEFSDFCHDTIMNSLGTR